MSPSSPTPKLFPFLKKRGWDLLCFGLVYAFLLYLVLNLHLFRAPHGDIFQYVLNGRDYLIGRLPFSMQIPPLHPILIQIFRHGLFFTSFPEFKAAIIINILSTIGSLVIIWLVARKLVGKAVTFFLLLLLMTHPRTLLGAVNVTPEPLLLFLVLLAIFLWTKKAYKNLGLVVAGLSAMVKTEGVLLVALFSAELILTELRIILSQKKQWEEKVAMFGEFLKKYWGVWVSNGLILALAVVTTVNNIHNQVPYTNHYLEEFLTRGQFFDFRFFYNLPHQLFFPAYIYHGPFGVLEWQVILTLAGLALITLTQRKGFVFYSLLFVWEYLVIHGLFPAHEDRYYLPVIFLTFLGLFTWFVQYRKKLEKIFLIAASLGICILYLTNEDIGLKKTGHIQYRSGYVDVAEWFTHRRPVEKNVLVIAEEPYFIYAQMENGGYFNPKKNDIKRVMNEGSYYFTLQTDKAHYIFVRFDQVPALQCDSFTCVAKRFEGQFDGLYTVYNYDNFAVADLEFFHNTEYLKLTRNPFDQDCFEELVVYDYDYRIMQYDLDKCADLIQSVHPVDY